MTQCECALKVVREWLRPIGPAVLLVDRLITESLTGLDCVIACFVSQEQLRVFVSQPAFTGYLRPETAIAVESWVALAEQVGNTFLRIVAELEDTREFLLVDSLMKVMQARELGQHLAWTVTILPVQPRQMTQLKAALGLEVRSR